jgi:hypothetical protein
MATSLQKWVRDWIARPQWSWEIALPEVMACHGQWTAWLTQPTEWECALVSSLSQYVNNQETYENTASVILSTAWYQYATVGWMYEVLSDATHPYHEHALALKEGLAPHLCNGQTVLLFLDWLPFDQRNPLPSYLHDVLDNIDDAVLSNLLCYCNDHDSALLQHYWWKRGTTDNPSVGAWVKDTVGWLLQHDESEAETLLHNALSNVEPNVGWALLYLYFEGLNMDVQWIDTLRTVYPNPVPAYTSYTQQKNITLTELPPD